MTIGYATEKENPGGHENPSLSVAVEADYQNNIIERGKKCEDHVNNLIQMLQQNEDFINNNEKKLVASEGKLFHNPINEHLRILWCYHH